MPLWSPNDTKKEYSHAYDDGKDDPHKDKGSEENQVNNNDEDANQEDDNNKLDYGYDIG